MIDFKYFIKLDYQSIGACSQLKQRSQEMELRYHQIYVQYNIVYVYVILLILFTLLFICLHPFLFAYYLLFGDFSCMVGAHSIELYYQKPNGFAALSWFLIFSFDYIYLLFVFDFERFVCKCIIYATDRSYDLVDSAAALEIGSPKAKRQRLQSSGNLSNDSISRNYCSQPMPTLRSDDEFNVRPGHDAVEGMNGQGGEDRQALMQEARMTYSFSQPAMLDNLLLATQMHQTQSASQNYFQRLVRRMTRFFVTTRWHDTIKRLVSTIERLGGYTCKVSEEGVVTVSTIDRRKLRLVFKAHIIEMDGKILVDFRLSKGCGLEFKRRFIKIKTALEDIVLKGPTTWPIAIATNCVPWILYIYIYFKMLV